MRKTLGIMVGATVLCTASIGLMATPGGAAPKTLKGAFTESFVTVPDGLANLGNLSKATNSKAGPGASVGQSYFVTGASSGTTKTVVYFANGSITERSTVILGPSSTGMPPISGKGTCSDGTGVFAGVKCTYTFTGTYDEAKGTSTTTAKGTYK